MPKMTKEARKQIAPFLKSMKERGLSLREIQKVLFGFRPLTWQAIKDILDKENEQEYKNKK